MGKNSQCTEVMEGPLSIKIQLSSTSECSNAGNCLFSKSSSEFTSLISTEFRLIMDNHGHKFTKSTKFKCLGLISTLVALTTNSLTHQRISSME